MKARKHLIALATVIAALSATTLDAGQSAAVFSKKGDVIRYTFCSTSGPVRVKLTPPGTSLSKWLTINPTNQQGAPAGMACDSAQGVERDPYGNTHAGEIELPRGIPGSVLCAIHRNGQLRAQASGSYPAAGRTQARAFCI